MRTGPFKGRRTRKWATKRCISALMATSLALPAGVLDAAAGVPGAAAEDNGVGLTPAMGWSSWSFLRRGPTAAYVEAEAEALVTSGLAKVGYTYVNLDDFWYVCPGGPGGPGPGGPGGPAGPRPGTPGGHRGPRPRGPGRPSALGPEVDHYGRWVTNSSFPPGPHGENGIEVVAQYVHRLGLKFGIYVTPGISVQAVNEDTPVLGANGKPSGYTAKEIANVSYHETNYNCGYNPATGGGNGAMVGLNYKSPGAQDFLDSWADEFASWGVDYLKLDGVSNFDIPDVEAWSRALRQTGRPIHLELSNSLNIKFASTWEAYSNGWRTGNDIECYSCEQGGSSYPLTTWANVDLRFDQVAAWQPYGKPGAFNDYDSIEVGNGNNDGLTVAERETQLSLWSLASAPLILGTDLTHLDPTDLALLKNTAVISVDQDATDAARVAQGSNWQIFAKKEKDGAVVVGLFNTGSRRETISTTVGQLGLAESGAYRLDNLWSHRSTRIGDEITAQVSSHGVALYRVTVVH